MTRGTLSWLHGAHHWWIHTAYVVRAWVWLYGRIPTWRQLLAMVLHDIGYLGCTDIDGDDGTEHPWRSYPLVKLLAGEDAADLVLCHSRTMCRIWRLEPSLLCWADKLATSMWLAERPESYIRRTRRTGELAEYRQRAADDGFLAIDEPDTAWAEQLAEHHLRLAVFHAPSDRLSYNARMLRLRMMREAA